MLASSGASIDDVNEMWPGGRSPLHFASQNNAVDMVKALLAAGAEVNVNNSWHSTPLHTAVRNNAY